MLTIKELITYNKEAYCSDPFACPYGMYAENNEGNFGCFAKFPNGDPNEPKCGCLAHQTAFYLKLMTDIQCENGKTLAEAIEDMVSDEDFRVFMKSDK